MGLNHNKHCPHEQGQEFAFFEQTPIPPPTFLNHRAKVTT